MQQSVIGVVGAGYVGLVSAACFARLGFEVVCHDIDHEKIAGLRAGRMPIYEDELADVVAGNVQRLEFTTDIVHATQRADVLLIAVPTPATASGDADVSAVEAVVASLPADTGDLVLAMKSTVPVGTGARVRRMLDDRGLGHVGYVSLPEFLREGTAVRDFSHPDRVVIGAACDAHFDRVEALHRALDAPVVRTDVASAEMIKYASNAFLATKISFINEIANVCEVTGADVEAVAHGMGLDERIGSRFLHAGIGFGGSCFPKDVSALKQLAGNSGYHFQLLNSVIEVNELQKRRIVAKLQRQLGRLRGQRIALLGLTFKPGTDDMRDAASLVLASRLLAEGAVVTAHDPVAAAQARTLLPNVAVHDSALDAVRDVDAAVLVTEWPEYQALDLERVASLMRRPLLVDGRNAFDPARVARAGLAYEAVGRAGLRTSLQRRRRDDQPASASAPAVTTAPVRALVEA